jgi:hypothetical protein
VIHINKTCQWTQTFRGNLFSSFLL